MSGCMGAPANEWLERYVDGTLPQQEVDAFEAHYFDCPACLAQVEALHAAREQLKRHPISIAPARRVFTWPTLTVGFSALAAALVLGFITLHTVELRNGPAPASAVARPSAPAPQSPQAPASADLAQLADLRLPPYQAPNLRGAGEASEIEQGMKLYNAGDCGSAVTKLLLVKKQSPDFLAARFYAGACQMQLGDQAASRTLRQVASAGNSPQQESALYYLAQIALKQSDAATARKDLQTVISLHGDLEQRARTQLARLPQDSSHP